MAATRRQGGFTMIELKAAEEAYKAEYGHYLSTGDLWPLSGGTWPADITGGLPATWTQLRIQPGRSALYCRYGAIAGTTPVAWFYVTADCDGDLFGSRGESSEIWTDNS